MAAITLKAIPLRLHQQLKSRARKNRRSLNQEVLATLEAAVAPAKRAPDDQEVPASFFRALADFKSGRVVNAERALREAPPKR